MGNEDKTVPVKSNEDLQISLAKVAFELARVSFLLEDFVCPPNPLVDTVDPQAAKARLAEAYRNMMDIAGDLLGMDKK